MPATEDLARMLCTCYDYSLGLFAEDCESSAVSSCGDNLSLSTAASGNGALTPEKQMQRGHKQQGENRQGVDLENRKGKGIRKADLGSRNLFSSSPLPLRRNSGAAARKRPSSPDAAAAACQITFLESPTPSPSKAELLASEPTSNAPTEKHHTKRRHTQRIRMDLKSKQHERKHTEMHHASDNAEEDFCNSSVASGKNIPNMRRSAFARSPAPAQDRPDLSKVSAKRKLDVEEPSSAKKGHHNQQNESVDYHVVSAFPTKSLLFTSARPQDSQQIPDPKIQALA